MVAKKFSSNLLNSIMVKFSNNESGGFWQRFYISLIFDMNLMIQSLAIKRDTFNFTIDLSVELDSSKKYFITLYINNLHELLTILIYTRHKNKISSRLKSR